MSNASFDTLERVAPKVLGDVLKCAVTKPCEITTSVDCISKRSSGERRRMESRKKSEHKVLKATAEKVCAFKKGRRANEVKLVVTQSSLHSSPSPLSKRYKQRGEALTATAPRADSLNATRRKNQTRLTQQQQQKQTRRESL